MSRTKCRALLPAAVLAAALSACAHTKVVTDWKDPGHQGFPKKVLVHGIAMSPTVKVLLENMLVERLKGRGLDALASNKVLPESMSLDKEAMSKVVRENGIDAILIGHPVDSKVIESFRPGHVSYGAVVHYSADGDFVMAAVGPIYETGIQTNEQAFAEFILFDVAAKKRVWVLHTKTFIRSTKTEEVKPAVDLIMERLRADAMIP
jgi:hypothetical protein